VRRSKPRLLLRRLSLLGATLSALAAAGCGDGASTAGRADGGAEVSDAQVAPIDVTATVDAADPPSEVSDAADAGLQPEVAETDPSWPAPPGVVSSLEVGCGNDDGTPGQFVDLAASAGFNLVRPQFWPPDSAYPNQQVQEGGGHAVADFNGDGALDIYGVVSVGADRLFLGDPAKPWSFQGFDVEIGATEETSATAADLDGDGDPDLVIGADGMRVLRNDGPDETHGVKWTDVTALAGLDNTKGLPLFSVAIGDVDRDGWLDLLIASNKFEKPPPWKGSWPPKAYLSRLLRGKGGMVFEDVSAAMPQPKSGGPSYISSLLDLDDDGDLDIYMTYDFGKLYKPNQIYRNDTEGPGAPLQFENVTALSGADIADAPMGLAWGDYDLDGRMDIYFTGRTNGNHLLHNESKPGGPIEFVDWGFKTGTSKNGKGYISWAAQFVDVDNGGLLDIYVANGKLFGQNFGGPGGGAFTEQQPDAQVDQLWRQVAPGYFTEAGAMSGVTATGLKRSVVRADFDRNGFVDFVVGSVFGPSQLYRNGCGGAAWLTVRLVAKGPNTAAIGGRVRLTVGAQVYTQDIDAGSTGLWGSSEPRAFFGLGEATQVDKLEVRWPNGAWQAYGAVPVRRHLTITAI
jgi:hypothetical protein